MYKPPMFAMLAILLGAMNVSKAQTFTVPLPPMGGSGGGPEALTVEDEGPELPKLRHREQICDKNDMEDVELYSGKLGPTVEFVKDVESSTVQLQWNDDLEYKYWPTPGNVTGVRFCTGTLVAQDLVLTAGHCFDPRGRGHPSGWITPRKDGHALEAAELAKNMHINFNYQVDGLTRKLRKEEKASILELKEYRRGNLDYAIVRIAEIEGNIPPGQKYGFRPLAHEHMIDGQDISIIQHPKGLPKKIEAGRQTKFDKRSGIYLYADIDTLGGSSGAGILDSAGRVIGVHTEGDCEEKRSIGVNWGVPILRILEFSETLK